MSEERDDPFDAVLRRAFALPPLPSLPRLPSRALELLDDPRIGSVMGGHYRLLERLGAGGAGTVYRARHRVLGSEVALKLLRPELAYDAEHRARLAREAQVIGQLQHEHIVSVIDLAMPENEPPLLVMELVRGHTLAALIAQGPLSPRRSVLIAMRIARALARAHELDVLHRDVKPSNVLLCLVDHDPDFVKLADFGLAQPLLTSRLTASAMVVGTACYMSPEQARGHVLGPATDLYSLGCVLYEMLCGSPPFSGSSVDVLRAHALERPPPLLDRAPGTPEPLAALVMRLLRKDPATRHRDAHHLLEELERLREPLAAQTMRPSSLPGGAAQGTPLRPPSHEPLEHAFLERVAQTRAQAAARHPQGLPPAVTQALARAQASAQRLAELGAELADELAGAALQDRDQHERAARLASALDVLAHDESAQARELVRLQARLHEAELAHGAAHEVLVQHASAQASTPQPGERLDEARARSLGALVEAAREVARRHEALTALRQQDAAREGALADVRFQIAALKGRIAALHAEARISSDAARAWASSLYARHQAELEHAFAALDSLTG